MAGTGSGRKRDYGTIPKLVRQPHIPFLSARNKVDDQDSSRQDQQDVYQLQECFLIQPSADFVACVNGGEYGEVPVLVSTTRTAKHMQSPVTI